MAENENVTTVETATAEVEPHGEQEVDWKAKYEETLAESRKWEKRSKENLDKAKKWDAYEQEGLSEAEKAAQRAEKAEAELAALKAEAQRNADAKEVATAAGIPESLLLFCSDREAMEAFAKAYAAENAVPAAPSAPASRVIRDGGAEVTTADQFAEMAEQFFRH